MVVGPDDFLYPLPHVQLILIVSFAVSVPTFLSLYHYTVLF